MLDILNLVVSVIIPAGLGVGVSWGIMSTRVDYLEKIIEELKVEVKDFRQLREDMAVVKNDISSIKDMLAKIIEDAE